jgi:mannosyltransferase OCH1-like enzyme
MFIWFLANKAWVFFQPWVNWPEEFPLNGPDRIPKILHQTWKNTQIPSKFIKWIKTWLVNHPDWEYWLWTDSI